MRTSQPSATATAPLRAVDSWIDGRYRLEAELGRGGMGAVYRAHDEGVGRVVALKLVKSGDERRTALFEREYETLSKLSHPRVIEVYDFGVLRDGSARYYTMELLAGGDLFSPAPLPWQRVCAHLRDVSTSLALLHALQLVHRDVNPRNVRLDAHGRAKLIDFGALTSFGVAPDIVCAPSCIAPEAYFGRALDGRSDLFSLGVVAYWSLCGRVPFPIHALHDAESAWQQPVVPPREHQPGLPTALDELVLALLSLDPLGRPASAEHVIDRLGALTSLDDESLGAIAESHFASAPFVGRAPEQTKLEPLLAQLARGQGAVLTVQGEQGIGKTRLLAELRIQGQLAGLSCLKLAGAAHTSRASLLPGLLRGLLRIAPRETRASNAFDAAALAPLIARLAAGSDEPASELEQVSAQAALATLVLDVSRTRPLLVVIDDAHLLHGAAAGVLPMLAQGTLEQPLFLVVAHASDQGPPAVLQLSFMGLTVALGPLEELAVERLVHGIFGEAPHRVRLAQWLWSTSHGHPGRLRAQLEDLVARQVVRHVGGAWVVPAELGEAVLARGSRELAHGRLEHLSETARALATSLAVHAGALSESVLLRLLPRLEPRKVLEALTELTTERLLETTASGHALRQGNVPALLRDRLAPHERTGVHLALARALQAEHEQAVAALTKADSSALSIAELVIGVSVGHHLLEGGEETSGRRILRNGAIELTMRGEGLTAVTSELESAVARFRASGGGAREYGAPIACLTLAGMYTDWRLSYRYGDTAMDVLCEVSGLTLARRLQRWLGGTLSLYVGLAVGFVLFMLVPGRRVANHFRELLLGLIGLGSAVLSVCCVVQDRARARHVGELLAPLGFFPRTHPVRMVHQFQRALLAHAEGDYAKARERSLSTLSYVRSGAAEQALPPRPRLQLEAGILMMLGHIGPVDVRLRRSVRVQRHGGPRDYLPAAGRGRDGAEARVQ